MVAASCSRAAYSLTDVTPARTIWVYRNGDAFYLGRKFVINHRYVPTFEAFMIQLNEGVPTPFGVRNVYTPREGHAVNELTDLQSGGKYVAAGRERFKKLNYFGIGAKKPQRKKKDELIRPVVHSNIQVPSKWQSMYNKPHIINVFTNGDMLLAPIKILIPRFTLTNWDCVLRVINEKVLLRSGGIQRLYTLHGQLVHGPEELQDNQFYVACSKEKFQSLPYWQNPKVPEHIRRNFADRTPEPPMSPKRKRLDTHTSRSKASPRLLPVQSPVEPPKKGEGDRHSVFYARSKKASPERAPKELSSDDGHSVFKAVKDRKETEGAQEVQEDKGVQVDLPVDKAPAEIVQEEDIYAIAENVEEQAEDDDGHYEDVDNPAKKGSFKRMLGLLSKPSKKKDEETESKIIKARVSNIGKEEELSDQHEGSPNMQQLQPMQKVAKNVQGISQNGMREERKKQDAVKRRDRLLIKQREFFDENDYY
ncbi:doublecortin domain-containing protein 2C [Eublepharis macularius]|uniref:Doublecortin domain-containing protein 2C n=1 Tax=Eublepharis macularius TaxID=481883 RepID=A0AA97KN60_EUBMA|nr:doublecortin domain-containing protein 2C [Eublepharis macularius]